MAKENVPIGGWEGYVNDLVSYVEKDPGFQARNTKIREGRDRRFRKQRVKIPEEYRRISSEFKSPFIFDILRRVPGLVATTLPTPKVRPYTEGASAQKNSSLREDWLRYGSVRMDKDCSTFFKIIDAIGADGCGCWKTLLDRHMWGAYGPKGDKESDGEYNKRVSEYHRAHWPIFREHVVTDTVYPLKDENGIGQVLQITKDSGAVLARKYGLSFTKDGWVKGRDSYAENPPDQAKFIEYWNREYFVYMVDDLIVKKGRHNYGDVPYFFAPLGETSSPKIEDQYFGLGWVMEPLCDKFDSFMTALENYAMISAFPYPTLKPISEMAIADEGQSKQVRLVQGEIYTPPMGYELVWMQPPNIHQDVIRVLDFLKNEIDRLGLAPVLYGLFQGEQSSASQQTAISVAKSILSAGINNICTEFNREARLRFRMIELLGEPVPIWRTDGPQREWLELGPEDLHGYYEVEHTLEPVIPAEQQMRYMFLADAQARGAITMNQLREEGLSINAPEKVDMDVMVETARKSTQYQNMLFSKWIEKFHPEEGGPYAGGAPEANLPVAPGGVGAQGAAGLNQGMQPEQRVATRPQGVGRG